MQLSHHGFRESGGCEGVLFSRRIEVAGFRWDDMAGAGCWRLPRQLARAAPASRRGLALAYNITSTYIETFSPKRLWGP